MRYQKTYQKENIDKNEYTVAIIVEVMLKFEAPLEFILSLKNLILKRRCHGNSISYMNHEYNH